MHTSMHRAASVRVALGADADIVLAQHSTVSLQVARRDSWKARLSASAPIFLCACAGDEAHAIKGARTQRARMGAQRRSVAVPQEGSGGLRRARKACRTNWQTK
jgi:hypothetical protein